MDTAEALKKTMDAIREAEIPESLWNTVFPLALADVRGEAPPAGGSRDTASTGGGATTTTSSPRRKPKPKPSGGTSGTSGVDTSDAVLSNVGDQDELFASIAAETDVSVEDLGDVFFVNGGKLQLKVAGKDLGDNMKAQTMTVTSLLTGVVFGGTDHKTLPINEVHEVCKSKRCFHEKNASTYVKAAEGVATVGSGKSLEITHKTGWQDEFKKAVDRVLGNGEHA